MKSPRGIVTLAAATLIVGCGAAWSLFQRAAPVSAVARVEPRNATSTLDSPAVPPAEAETPDVATKLPDRMATFTPDVGDPDRTSPLRALTRAGAEPDPVRRVEIMTAELREWAAGDMDAAGEWALWQAPIPRDLAMAAVIAGAVEHDPDDATELVERASAQDPERAAEFGRHLIFALGEIGEHQRAAAWAQSGDDASALDWMTAAYDHWAAHDPEVALLSAVEVVDPLRRRAAVEAAVGAWARRHPEALAESAIDFLPGPERSLALVTALRSWLATEPDVAEKWVQSNREKLAGVERLDAILEE